MRVGKRLPDALYLHADALPDLDDELRRIIDGTIVAAGGAPGRWNVVKLWLDAPKLSLLSYPRFFDDAFPALAAGAVVDLVTAKVTHRVYSDDNPPILHRKEALLGPGHPAVPAAAEVTRVAEQLGLLEEAASIGTRLAWEARMQRVGVRVEGNALVVTARGTGEVHRHRTAMTRYSLSTPMQALWRHGFLDGAHSVFDYGCGRGDDLRALRERGIEAAGWDPHYAPELPIRDADVVNLGFVLNVIEDVAERDEALQRAWALSRRLLVVGVLIGGRSAYERHRLFRDGVLTARGTFQKYFAAAELREYLERRLGREPVALAPGIAFVFRSDADEQAFLARRASARAPATSIPTAPRPQRPTPTARPSRSPRPRPPSKWEIHAELVEAFWQRCLTLGRVPELDEFERVADLRDALGVPATVLRALLKERGREAFEAAQQRRRDDLLVFLALNLFERRRSFGGLPDSVRRDVKAALGSYQNAQAEAQRLLFSAGRPEVVRAACHQAAERGVGFLDGEHSLQLHSSMAGDLPAVLRVYLGCAARLYGDVETADLVKIHIDSGKLSLMSYDDFEDSPLPSLIERVKINLRRQEIDFFEYGTPAMPQQPVYVKSRFIRPDFPRYDEQVEFDRQLEVSGLFDLTGFGPPADALRDGLARAGLAIEGFRLVPVGARP